jgi:hypothetical protein
MSHISDDLPGLLTGEASREQTLAAAAHLRSCPDCQQELVSAVVAHASLSSARRFAPGFIEPTDDAAAPELPDLSDMFAKVRDEAAKSGAGRTKRRRLVLAVAAVAVLGTAAGVTIAETTGSTSEPAGTSVALAAFGDGRVGAEATLIGAGTMRVDAAALPRLTGGRFYEVWLTNSARTRMQAVGSLGDDNEAQLTVSPKVMGRYSAIEISVQKVGQTDYSGHSVLRGSYG